MEKYLLFTADWSKPSRDMENLLLNFLSDVPVDKCRIETEPEKHKKFAIRQYPTMVRLVDDVEVARTIATDLVEIVTFMKRNENVEEAVRPVEEESPQRE